MSKTAQVWRMMGVAGFAALSWVSGFIKLSFMVGSQTAWFSATNCIAPVAGVWYGVLGSYGIFLIRALTRIAFYGIHAAHFLHGIPTLCASLYLSSTSAVVRIILPMVCMLLFWAHPVGFQAGVYPLFWFIPIIVGLYAMRSFFLLSLASTFTAHAVGSVIWLYTVTMEPAMWVSLMPVVIVERFLFAAGMTFIYHAQLAIVTAFSLLKNSREVACNVRNKA